ncbi:P-loop containing nucleoside triphosphate hydrolase protein [Periconia macrospinosa]|uniref:P-loop containing nucleoside triphosphate hydrolase protein n=1 Tax=Periconia macrospinosa TaxID=97972 RepID=A0A2V1DV75_9PLEO|nr:P-loop containing nucleoside triphosphate hydrolase protein [Periconia macrospinosa]
MDTNDGLDYDVVTNIDILFFHFRQFLQNAPQQLDREEGDALQYLINYLIQEFDEKHQAMGQTFASGIVTRSTLKYLFKRGDVVVFHEDRSISGAKLKSFEATTKDEMHIVAESYAFDGKFYLQEKKRDLRLPRSIHNELATEINSLPCYPILFAAAEVKERLDKRGHRFWKCRQLAYVAYNGPNAKKDTDYTNTRFLVDVRTYQTIYGDRISPHHSKVELDDKLMSDEEPPAELVYMVPENIFGFDIQEKKWVDIEVDNISDIQWNKNAFKTLAIEDESKELVNALVNNKINADKATDTVMGKGNGLILLLHGGPGTGKTLTAESVAEIAEKPLYRVTCGDIGTEPRQVEEYLQKVFYLGKIWDCVVLLDEADVFLEQRTLADLTRNALVSVFLRTLEYYDGILILTSNRVGTFDEAFKSRIQLALHYKKLDRAQREHIWTNFLDRLKDLGENFNEREIRDKINVLSAYEMNGRQIRNAITTARQLALFRKTALSWNHLEHSIKVSGQFDKYLEEVHNQIKDDDMAREEGWR